MKIQHIFIIFSILFTVSCYYIAWRGGKFDVPDIRYLEDSLLGEGSNEGYVRYLDTVHINIYTMDGATMQRVRVMMEILNRFGFKNMDLYIGDRSDYFETFKYLETVDVSVWKYRGFEILDNMSGGRYLTINLYDYPVEVMDDGNLIYGISRYENIVMYNCGDDRLFYSTLIHEIFHSFGSLHCWDKDCLMYPIVNRGALFENGRFCDIFCSGHYDLYCKLFGNCAGS